MGHEAEPDYFANFCAGCSYQPLRARGWRFRPSPNLVPRAIPTWPFPAMHDKA